MLLYPFLLLLAAGLVNFYFALKILRRVSEAQVKIGFFELRWQVHKHMGRYKELTRADSGQVGTAYYGYWLSLLAMLAAGGWLFASLPWHSLSEPTS